MTIAGTFPDEGMRVALDLKEIEGGAARYIGAVFTPAARYDVDLAVALENGAATLHVGDVVARTVPAVDGDARVDLARVDLAPMSLAPPSLNPGELAFVRQLGRQAWRLATQTPVDRGGGQWPRRLQRWRGAK